MSTTVAVALITAISTLAGGAISGYITFLISRGNNRVQMAVTRENLLDKCLVDRRQIRRTAYVQYLNQLSSAERTLDAAWTAPLVSGVAGHIGLLKACSKETEALTNPANVVLLEGPSDVSRVILALGVRLTLENTLIVNLAGSHKGKGALCLENEELFRKAKLERGKAKEAMLKAARQALNDTNEIAAGSYYPRLDADGLKAEGVGDRAGQQRTKRVG